MTVEERLLIASENGNLTEVKSLIKLTSHMDWPLQRASTNGHLEIVKCLCDGGANIHADSEYALRCASQNGHIEVVKYLVKRGANIHALNDAVITTATNSGNLEIIRFLESRILQEKRIKGLEKLK